MEQQKSKAKKESTRTGYVKQLTVLIIITVILIAVVGLSQLQDYMYQLHASKNIVALTNNIAALKQELATQQTQVTESSGRLQHLEKWRDRFSADTVIPEVAYLIKLADINLRLNGDVEHAIVLLAAADKRASTLSQNKYLDLRRALADDLATLKTTPKFDLVGTVLKINALDAQLAALKQVPTIQAQKQLQPIVVEPENTGSIWTRFWNTTVKYMRNIVLIEHNSAVETPLPTVSERQYLINYIQLNLLQAKWAIFQHNAKLYELSLKQIKEPIALVFAHNIVVKRQIDLELTNLLKININPKLPDINNSLQISKRILAQQFSKESSS